MRIRNIFYSVLLITSLGLSANPAHAKAIEISSLINTHSKFTLIRSAYAILEYQIFKEILPPICKVNDDDDPTNDTDYPCRAYSTLENKKIYIKLNGSIKDGQGSYINLKGKNKEEGLEKLDIKIKYSDLLTDSAQDLLCLIKVDSIEKKIDLPVSSFSLSRQNKSDSNLLSQKKVELEAQQAYTLIRKDLGSNEKIRNIRIRLGFKI